MPRTVLLIGATGLVGAHVLELLLADASPQKPQVLVLTRRSTARTHERLTERVVDFDSLAALPALPAIDDVFACLGTTLKAAGSQERFRLVDHDYTLAIAHLAHAAGARRLALVSSIGANEHANNFYLRVKGETERDLRAVTFTSIVIARPSFLVGKRAVGRLGERLGIGLARLVAPLMLGLLRLYRPIDARCVAAALVASLQSNERGERILTHDELVTSARTSPQGGAASL